MTTETKREWRAVKRRLVYALPKGTEAWAITDSSPASSIERPIASCYSAEKAQAAIDYLNALEACADALEWALDSAESYAFSACHDRCVHSQDDPAMCPQNDETLKDGRAALARLRALRDAP